MIYISLLLWNIRGVNNSVARQNLRDLVVTTKASIICLQESKSQHQGMSFFVSDRFKCFSQPSQGLSGGLITGWDSNEVKCVALAQAQDWIWTCFKSSGGNEIFHVINIYSPHLFEKKRNLWEELRQIMDCIREEPLCIVDDFNCVRSQKEKHNCAYQFRELRDFNDWITDCNLLELHMVNAQYTWFGAEGKKSKLDRVLVNSEWSSSGIWQVKALNRKHSDHKPLFLYAGSIKSGPKPFKVFDCYLNNDLLEHIKCKIPLNLEWDNLTLYRALKFIKGNIKEHSKGYKNCLENDIKNLEVRMEQLEQLDNPGKDFALVRGKLMEKYEQRDEMLRQKARINWMAKGDGNNRFFHQAIQKRASINTIHRIFKEGHWLTDASQIREVFYDYYCNFFKDSSKLLLDLGSLGLPCISESAKNQMVRNISQAEVVAALNSLAENKAPGPDGMNIKCLKFIWPCVGNKVMSFITNFCDSGYLPTGLNSSFITLIPKIQCPTLVRDFRPISLINSSVKILLKVLATRLAGHLDSLISDTQTGFIRGRQASESILLVKEVAHSIQKLKCKGFILKLDFEKAFDSVNWNFLIQTMERMNFDCKWCNWIKSLWESTRISILVNGTPSREFSPQGGLRQGDPISPLLFNLAGEVLNAMLTLAASRGIFKGILMRKGAGQITHLQFADDTVVFLDGSEESAKGIKRVLQCFQLVSGLKINYNKSNLYADHRFSNEALSAANILGCKVGYWPLMYLGIPIGYSPRRSVFWEPLVRKVQSKLAKWKACSLNQAGRLTLVKSVLDSVPIYWMNTHSIPMSVSRKLEQIRINFFWGSKVKGNESSRKIHLASWDKVCKPKSCGGLGIVSIQIRNQALLGKWHYRWLRERDRSWNKWIREKYNLHQGASMEELSTANKLSDSLRDIYNVSQVATLHGSLNMQSFKWELRDGKSILLWEDFWIGDTLLKYRFKKLFLISQFKESSVYTFKLALDNSSILDSKFWMRQLRAWEEDDAIALELLVQSVKFSKGSDFLVWSVSHKDYSVSKATSFLAAQHSVVSWQFIWKLRIPNKIKTFLWKVHLNILPTGSFLHNRGILPEAQVTCKLCSKFPETSHHLFFQCANVVRLWDSIAAWWNIQPIMVQDLGLHAVWAHSKQFPTKFLRMVWKVVVSSSIWSIWLSRNNEVFKKSNTTSDNLLNLVRVQSKEWAIAFSLIHKDAAYCWFRNPVGVVTGSEEFKIKEIISTGAALKGFVDGSWKEFPSKIQAGIGGFIQNIKGDIIFTFSGPVSAHSPFDSEWSALVFLVSSFLKSSWNHLTLKVFTDSRKVVCRYLEEVSSLNKHPEFRGNLYAGHARISGEHANISVNFVPSEINHKADFLAKKRAKKISFSSHWVHKF